MVFVNYEVVLARSASEPGWLRTLAGMFEGNASALFVTLAGGGIVLLGRRVVVLRRALLLLVFGYIWQVMWPGDILHYYAFYLTGGALCLGLRPGWLWLLAAAAVGGFVWAFTVFDYGLGWNWTSLSYPEFWTARGQLRNLLFNGWHPLLPWLAFLFAGMALARWGVERPGRRRVALGVSLACYATALGLSAVLSAYPDTRPGIEQLQHWYRAPAAIWGTSSLPPGPLYVLSAGSAAVFVLAACLELCDRPRIARWCAPLARAGQFALSFYLLHVLLLYFVVVPLAGSFSVSPLVVAFVATVAFGLLAVIGANSWPGRRGPCEWLMRKLCG